MNYKTHNEKEINVNYTSLVGEIDISYRQLVKLFGRPSDNFDHYKSDAEWSIEFEDGKVATIYNYKDGKNYNGKQGIAKSRIRDWHIGGHDKDAYDRVVQIVSLFLRTN